METRVKSTPVPEEHEQFLSDVVHLVLQAALHDTQRKQPVLRWRNPEYLKEILKLSLPKEGVTHDELLHCLKDVIQYSAKTGHPHFVNQLFSSVDPYGLAGQLVTDALNPSVYTFEVAPVFTLMESEVIRTVTRLIGFSNGDGIFCPGGSFANGFAINLARYNFNPLIKKSGVAKEGSGLVLFASQDAHYSVHKMAAFLGLGEDSVIAVATDSLGRMDVRDLEQCIHTALDHHRSPFMIFATAGTTVLGGFDPIKELARVASEYGLWLHVDAAWGGGLLFSKKHRHLLDGVELADSVTWNPHKLLAVPQQCSLLLVRHQKLLLSCHRKNADYLFQKDKFYDTEYDLGDQYLQCGRRADVLKLWLMWQSKGDKGFEQHVDHIMDMSHYLLSQVRSRPGFQLVAEPQFINVCFWYIPKNLEKFTSHPDYFHKLHKVAPAIKAGLLRRGSLMINYQPHRNWPNFFRFVCQNSALTVEDVSYFLNEIQTLVFETVLKVPLVPWELLPEEFECEATNRPLNIGEILKPCYSS